MGDGFITPPARTRNWAARGERGNMSEIELIKITWNPSQDAIDFGVPSSADKFRAFAGRPGGVSIYGVNVRFDVYSEKGVSE